MGRKEKADGFRLEREELGSELGIRLAALDMDDTLLRSDGTLSDKNRSALICALEAGIQVVPASGRSLCAMPDEVLSIPGMEYAVTSNGARVVDLETGKTLYQNGLSPKVIEAMFPLFDCGERIIEVFSEGQVYAPSNYVQDPAAFGVTDNRQSYIRETRIPVEDIFSFLRLSIGKVESINSIYKSDQQKEADRQIFSSYSGMAVTSSMVYNLEIIGETTSKADGLAHLCALLDISPKQVIVCGDSGNDTEMFAFAGISVAMKNAAEEIRKAAGFTTLSNDEDGVAAALKRFVFDPQRISFHWKGGRDA